MQPFAFYCLNKRNIGTKYSINKMICVCIKPNHLTHQKPQSDPILERFLHETSIAISQYRGVISAKIKNSYSWVATPFSASIDSASAESSTLLPFLPANTSVQTVNYWLIKRSMEFDLLPTLYQMCSSWIFNKFLFDPPFFLFPPPLFFVLMPRASQALISGSLSIDFVGCSSCRGWEVILSDPFGISRTVNLICATKSPAQPPTKLQVCQKKLQWIELSNAQC